MKEIRIFVRCEREPNKHAKVLCLGFGDQSKANDSEFIGYLKNMAATLAGLLEGNSPLYIHKPGPGSPIGRCGVCGAGPGLWM